MNVFKTKDSKSKFIPINERSFEAATHQKPPYCIVTGEKRSYHALCPICENPITIVGLYRKEDSGRKPYGKHHKGTIPKLAVYDEEAYLNCPFSHPTLKHHGKRNPTSKTSHELYRLMYDQFDRVIYIWNKTMPIFLSNTFALDQLRAWIVNKEWLNYSVTYFNLPYMLNYTGPALKLICRLVKEDSELAKSLAKRKELELEPSRRKGYLKVLPADSNFVELTFFLTRQKYTVVDDSLCETIQLMVDLDSKTIYKETISVDHAFVDRLFNKSSDETYRNLDLLKKAQKIMDSKAL